MDCIFCWQYNPLHPYQDVVIRNSKYCKLYAKSHQQNEKQIPNFEHCKTLYTKCDYILEKKVHENIIKLEKLFKEYQTLLKKEVEMQAELLNDMWIQSQRYIILTRSGVCIKSYPESISLATEKRCLCSFYINLTKINKSNCILAQSMENILETHSELNNRCKQLDITVESPFIIGVNVLNSLAYIRNVLDDLLHYFYSNFCKMKCWAQVLEPGDSVSVEDYMSLIKANKENEVIEYINSCYCLHGKSNECLASHKPC